MSEATPLPILSVSDAILFPTTMDSNVLDVESSNIVVVKRSALPKGRAFVNLPDNPPIGTTIIVLQNNNNELQVYATQDINFDVRRNTNALRNFTGRFAYMTRGSTVNANYLPTYQCVFDGSKWLCTGYCANIRQPEFAGTLVASRAYCMVQEYNTSPVTLTFTYKDDTDYLYDGKVVTVSSNKPSDKFVPSAATTGDAGTSTFLFSSNVSSTSTVTANCTNLDGVPLTVQTNISVSSDQSTIAINANPLNVDTAGYITVTIRDANANVYQGKTIHLVSNQASDVISPSSAVTNVSGQALFTIQSAIVHNSDVSVINDTDLYTASAVLSLVIREAPVIRDIPP